MLSILLSFIFLLPNTAAGKTISHTTNLMMADTASKKAKAIVNYPVPNTPAKLFYLQRDPNSNTIVYDLNYNTDGSIDKSNPVHVYWIRYNDKGQKEELNFIQRKFAYGIVTKSEDNGKFDIRLVSYKKYPLSLMKSDADNKYHIFATIANKQAILTRVFVRIDGGSFWIPNVLYVEVKGTDPVTGKEIMERFKP
jgi:hypothetical protein